MFETRHQELVNIDFFFSLFINIFLKLSYCLCQNMTNPEDRNFKFTQIAKVSKDGVKKKERKGKKKQKRINGLASTTPENKGKLIQVTLKCVLI